MGLMLRWLSLRMPLTWAKRFALGLVLFYLAYALLGYLDPGARSQGRSLLANLSGSSEDTPVRHQAVGTGAALAASNQSIGGLFGVIARLAMPAAVTYYLLGGADLFDDTPRSGDPTTHTRPAGAQPRPDGTRSTNGTVQRRPASY